MNDLVIIGAGPAGTAAALSAQARGMDFLLISNDPQDSMLARAERIDNYPGLPQVTGQEMVAVFQNQLASLGIKPLVGRVVSALPFGDGFMVSIGQNVQEARTIILAIGLTKAKGIPREEELLGKGVSYCATCDGMLYRDQPVCVLGDTAEAQEEANFLAQIGCKVTYVSNKPAPLLDETIKQEAAGRHPAVLGDSRVEGFRAADKTIPCNAVFILRPAIAPTALLPGLEMEESSIKVDSHMQTSIPGVFAAGDCTGKPLQIAKAVGEGQQAVFSCLSYLAQNPKRTR